MKIVGGLQLATLTGAEIGALARPVVQRSDGPVIYVDHADTETLRNKYQSDPYVDTSAIVDVGGVWGKNTLLEALGKKVDYIVASHVIEHVPDLITWLCELVAALKPGGEIRLVIPDKRFTFDFKRRVTVLADVTPAYQARTRRPLPDQVLDFARYYTLIDAADRWRGKGFDTPTEFTLQQAQAFASDAASGTYRDVHCWVFTPASFASLMRDLVGAGLIAVQCSQFYDTELGDMEFFVQIKAGSDLSSWQEMERQCTDWERTLIRRFHPRVMRHRLQATFPRAASVIRRIVRR
ncbi:methyltransferase domain-containing protein [Paraburkholderia flava]|uniref:methyltransferase domain-containing protein n=1 Tax=Paraburkholderia flava TaxID=2547393 RepID=UPI001F0ED3BB|nr:class I SAM-dependent methyltransferase [Paraburkholderia flava]